MKRWLRITFLVAISIIFYCISDSGYLTQAGGAFFALIVALIKPDFSPYLLVLLASIHDAPGLANKWEYVGFVAVSSVLFISKTIQYLHNPSKYADNIHLFNRLNFLVLAAVLVILYGLCVSTLYNLLSGLEQSSEKPYFVVALLMIGMIIAAYLSMRTLLDQSEGMTDLAIVSCICIVHSLIIPFLQLFYGVDSFRSPAGMALVEEASQLTQASILGLPRITGPFLSPNALALTVALFFMILLGAREEPTIRIHFALSYLLIGIVLGLLTLSKAMTAFFILSSIILFFRVIGPKFFIILIMLLTTAVVVIISTELGDVLSIAFRFGGSDLGYRSEAWHSVIQQFGIQEWLFGSGLSHWRVFFGRTIGIPLADPHSFLLSVPGTFGILGILFYLVLAFFLLQKLIDKHNRRWLLVVLTMILLFGKDLVSVPYVFGNTTVSFLLWLILCMIFTRTRNVATTQPSSAYHEI